MTPLNTILHRFHSLVLVTVLVCAALAIPTFADAQDEIETQTYPPHVDLATLGTVLGLRGLTASEQGLPVKFAPEVLELLTDPVFQYENFLLNTFIINGYATIRDEPDTWHAYGVLVFEDVGGRRAYTQFSTYYRVQQSGLEIYRASARPITPGAPTFAWFAMHEDDVSAEMLAPENHAYLVSLAGKNSLVTVPSDMDDYVVFALSMDRFSDRQEVRFESRDDALSIETLNLGGWPVGIFSGRINPDHFENVLTVQISGGDREYEQITLPSFPTRPFVWE